MSAPHLSAALLLLLVMVAGLLRLFHGTGRTQRLLALQLFGTAAVAVVLLLAQGLGSQALRDLALVLALLAPVVAVAFVRRGHLLPPPPGRDHGDP